MGKTNVRLASHARLLIVPNERNPDCSGKIHCHIETANKCERHTLHGYFVTLDLGSSALKISKSSKQAKAHARVLVMLSPNWQPQAFQNGHTPAKLHTMLAENRTSPTFEAVWKSVWVNAWQNDKINNIDIHQGVRQPFTKSSSNKNVRNCSQMAEETSEQLSLVDLVSKHADSTPSPRKQEATWVSQGFSLIPRIERQRKRKSHKQR